MDAGRLGKNGRERGGKQRTKTKARITHSLRLDSSCCLALSCAPLTRSGVWHAIVNCSGHESGIFSEPKPWSSF